MSDALATTRPWVIEDGTGGLLVAKVYCGPWIHAVNDPRPASAPPIRVHYAESYANARLIVTAVNAHDQLVGVARSLDEFQKDYECKTHDFCPGNSVWSSRLVGIVTAARAAIAQVEEP